jgi:ribosome biogenesis GTPase
LPDGGLLIDTAGLREFQPWAAAGDLDSVFPEVAELAENCRFRDCRHEGEPGCAVQAALGDGSLDARRFEHLLAAEARTGLSGAEARSGRATGGKTRWKQIAQWQKEFLRHREK